MTQNTTAGHKTLLRLHLVQTSSTPTASSPPLPVRIVYGSTKGTCKQLAAELAQRLTSALASLPPAPPADLGCDRADCCRATDSSAPAATLIDSTDLSSYEPEQLLSETTDTLVVVVISTYEGGSPPESARFFCRQVAVAGWRRGGPGL